MSDRVKLMLGSLTVLMLPSIVLSLTVLILTAIMTTAFDLAKERFGHILGIR